MATSAGTLKMVIKIEGVPAIKSKLSGPNPIWRSPIRRALDQAARLFEREAKRLAPSDTGRLAGSFSIRIRPTMAIITVGARAQNKRFRYPFALETSQAVEYHYRRGSGQGSRTLGWFTKALGLTQDRINAILAAAQREVETRWG
jgi:hypothetical protein